MEDAMGNEQTAGTGTTDAGAAAATTTATETATTTKPASDAAATTAAETTTTKPADGTAAADVTKEKPADTTSAETSAATAPEKYTLTVPDGGRIDDDDVKAVEAIAREQGWTNDQAQAALESHAQALAAQSERFLAHVKADPTYGGEHLVETQQLVRRALDKLRPAGTPRGDALRRLLDKSGYGNHLEVVSFLADLGKQMAEDRPGAPRSTDAARTTRTADALYPKTAAS
jgi:hypothetical protein